VPAHGGWEGYVDTGSETTTGSDAGEIVSWAAASRPRALEGSRPVSRRLVRLCPGWASKVIALLVYFFFVPYQFRLFVFTQPSGRGPMNRRADVWWRCYD